MKKSESFVPTASVAPGDEDWEGDTGTTHALFKGRTQDRPAVTGEEKRKKDACKLKKKATQKALADSATGASPSALAPSESAATRTVPSDAREYHQHQHPVEAKTRAIRSPR